MAKKNDTYRCENEYGTDDGKPPCPNATEGRMIEMPPGSDGIDGSGPKCPHEECGEPLVLVRKGGGGSGGGGGGLPMKLIIGVVAVIALVLLAILWPKGGPPPAITVAPAVNFGEVEPNKSTIQTLAVVNNGDGLLEVGELRIDPPVFTTAESSFEVAAGETHHLKLTFKPTAEGDFNGKLVVVSNDPDFEEVDIKLIGKAGKFDFWAELDGLIGGSKAVKP